MTIGDKIRDEKLQSRKAAKISALLSGKIDKYANLTSKQILPPDESTAIQQARLIGKALEKQPKTIGSQGRKQIDNLKVLEPDAQQLTFKDVTMEDQLNEEAKNEIERIKEIEK